MRIGMIADLVTVADDEADQLGIALHVGPTKEECGAAAGVFEGRENLWRILAGAVVKRQSHRRQAGGTAHQRRAQELRSGCGNQIPHQPSQAGQQRQR